MRKCAFITLLWFIFFGTFSTGASAEDTQAASQWLSSPLNIDGVSDDWADVPPFKQEKMGIDLFFRNNENTLFLLIKYNDRQFFCLGLFRYDSFDQLLQIAKSVIRYLLWQSQAVQVLGFGRPWGSGAFDEIGGIVIDVQAVAQLRIPAQLNAEPACEHLL